MIYHSTAFIFRQMNNYQQQNAVNLIAGGRQPRKMSSGDTLDLFDGLSQSNQQQPLASPKSGQIPNIILTGRQ